MGRPCSSRQNTRWSPRVRSNTVAQRSEAEVPARETWTFHQAFRQRLCTTQCVHAFQRHSCARSAPEYSGRLKAARSSVEAAKRAVERKASTLSSSSSPKNETSHLTTNTVTT